MAMIRPIDHTRSAPAKPPARPQAAQPTHAVTLRLTGSRADVARALAAACRPGVTMDLAPVRRAL